MKRFLKALSYLFLFFLFLIGIVWYFVDFTKLDDYIATEVRTALVSNNIPIKFEKAKLGLSGISFSSIIVTPPRSPISFRIDDISLQSSIMKLYGRDKSFQLMAAAYGGNLQSDFVLAQNGLTIPQFVLSKINLAGHNTIRGFGITNAILDISAKDFTFDPQRVAGGGVINISNITIPTETQVIIPGLPLPLKVQPLQGGALSAPFKVEKDTLLFPSINFNSSWGTVRGIYEIDLKRGKTTPSTAIRIQLTDDGIKSVGPYLMLACQPEKVRTGYELQFKPDHRRNGYLVCS